MLHYTEISLQNFNLYTISLYLINIIKYFPISVNLQKCEQQFHRIFSIFSSIRYFHGYKAVIWNLCTSGFL